MYKQKRLTMRLTTDEVLRIAVILAVGEGCESSLEIVAWVRSRWYGLQKAGAAAYSKEQIVGKVEELTQNGELMVEESIIVL